MRLGILASFAMLMAGTVPAGAQTYMLRTVMPGSKAAVAAPVQTGQTTCRDFNKDYWLMSGPYTVINQGSGITSDVAALAWCNSRKPPNMKGGCIWQQNATIMLIEGGGIAYSGQPGIGLNAAFCS